MTSSLRKLSLRGVFMELKFLWPIETWRDPNHRGYRQEERMYEINKIMCIYQGPHYLENICMDARTSDQKEAGKQISLIDV